MSASGVVPYIGGGSLQQLKPIELTALYRQLLESGRRQPTPPARVHPPEVGAMVDRLRADGLTWQAIADEVSAAFPEEAGLTRHAVAGLHRRRKAPPASTTGMAGLKPRTVLYVHSIIHAVLRGTMPWNRGRPQCRRRRHSPTHGVDDARPPHDLDGRPAAAVPRVHRQRPPCTPWIFLATTGCRRGECLGLRWSDLDLDESTAIISRQVTSIDHEIGVKELPKTKRGHMVSLTRTPSRWRAQQNEQKLLVGPGYVDEGCVFCKPDGTVPDPDRFSREFLRKQEQFNRARADADLPRLTLHGCATRGRPWRSTMASTSRSSAIA